VYTKLASHPYIERGRVNAGILDMALKSMCLGLLLFVSPEETSCRYAGTLARIWLTAEA
jgi:hypothetical protein